MSILDPSIILQAGNINDPNKLLALKLGMQKLQAGEQAMQQQNALKALLGNPQSYQNGQLTPQAKQAVFAADPSLGLDIHKQDVAAQLERARAAAAQTKAGAAKFDFYAKTAGAGVTAYEDAKNSGKSEEEARSIAIQARNTALKEAYDSGSGIISQADLSNVSAQGFDPNGATALASMDKDWVNARAKSKADERADKRLDLSTNVDLARLGIERDRLNFDRTKSNEQTGRWEVLTDTKKDSDGNTIQYRYNPATGEATTLDASKPYSPSGASRLGAASKTSAEFTPEMGQLMGALAEQGVSLPAGMRSKEQQVQTYGGILARNPDKTPDQIAKMIKTGQIEFGAQKKETQTAATSAGKVEVAQNELEEAIPLVRDASAKVPRGNFVPVTRLLQMGDTSISDPNLKQLKIYINSVLNSYDQLAARGGTDATKREEARSLITSADSPEALDAALKAFQAEAEVAHRAAVKATKVPELPGETKSGGKSADAGDHSKLSNDELLKKLGLGGG